MKTIFLESHHLKNRFFGFGQFNSHLIKSLSKESLPGFELIIHGKHPNKLKNEFGTGFTYKKYYPWRRYKNLRIRKKYDLWHSMNQNTSIEPFYNIPYLLTVHNITHIKNPENYKDEKVHRKFQEKLNRSNAITYISEYAKQSTHQFFNVPNIPEYVIYNGNPLTDTDLPANYKPGYIPEKPFLFSIGQITARKNFISLVRMLSKLNDLQLVIGGKNTTDTAKELLEEAEKLGVKDRVFLTGNISDNQKKYYYANCEAFVFPSLREGFGLPIIEAMLFGKPVFTSNNTSLPEIGGDLAYYWDHYDPSYMANILEKGLENFSENKNTLEQKLIKRAESFNWDSAAKQYAQVYQSIISK